MELLLILIGAGIIGYFIGKSRPSTSNQPPSQQIVDTQARDVQEGEQTVG